jgi:hypothetical protein
MNTRALLTNSLSLPICLIDIVLVYFCPPCTICESKTDTFLNAFVVFQCEEWNLCKECDYYLTHVHRFLCLFDQGMKKTDNKIRVSLFYMKEVKAKTCLRMLPVPQVTNYVHYAHNANGWFLKSELFLVPYDRYEVFVSVYGLQVKTWRSKTLFLYKGDWWSGSPWTKMWVEKYGQRYEVTRIDKDNTYCCISFPES